jgi:aryl-alcohol dehydrogenase-like predicted oxidoreductase
LPARIKLDLVQAPFNVLDRRLEFSGWLTRLAQENVEIHVRSIFLQGLLLMNNETRPAMFAKWTPTWARWQDWLDEQQVAPLRACLGFALSVPHVDRVVVGIDSVAHLREILDCMTVPVVSPPPGLMNGDPDLINPSRWNGL